MTSAQSCEEAAKKLGYTSSDNYRCIKLERKTK